MDVLMKYNSPVHKEVSVVITTKDSLYSSDIKALFYMEFGVPFNPDNCSYWITCGYSIDEMLAYTE